MTFLMREAGAQDARHVLGLLMFEKRAINAAALARRLEPILEKGITPERAAKFQRNLSRTGQVARPKESVVNKALISNRDGGQITNPELYHEALNAARGLDKRQALRSKAQRLVRDAPPPPAAAATMRPPAPSVAPPAPPPAAAAVPAPVVSAPIPERAPWSEAQQRALYTTGAIGGLGTVGYGGYRMLRDEDEA